MPKKRTPKEFIELAKKVNPNKFDYSLVKYINNTTKITLRCKKCNYIFKRTPKDHLKGYGCPKCNGAVKLTKEEYIKRVNKKYNNKYDYSKLEFDDTKPVNVQRGIFICPKHGEFEQSLHTHLYTGGCNRCGVERTKVPLEVFKEKSIIIHNGKYDYSDIKELSEGSRTKVPIRCPKHGIFKQEVRGHMSGQGCPKCKLENLQLNQDDVIRRMKKVHPHYDYSKVHYKTLQDKVTLICPDHGEFDIRPGNVINLQQGCPKCAASSREKRILRILEKYNIKYIYEYPVMYNEKRYRYDFYIPDINIFIEHHGQQHRETIKKWGDFIYLEDTKRRDKEKEQLAKELGKKLYIIWYDEDLEKSLDNILKRYYKYKIGFRLYKTALELMQDQGLPLDTKLEDIKKWRW